MNMSKCFRSIQSALRWYGEDTTQFDTTTITNAPPQIGTIAVSPASIALATPTTITVTAAISDPSLLRVP
jgi:hypothetical protein